MINSARSQLIERVKLHEGFREVAYLDSLGLPTFGYGFRTITKEEADVLLQHRIDKVIIQVEDYIDEQEISIDETRITILCEMAYQLGFDGLKRFKNMWNAIKNMDYETAGQEMLKSKWHTQTPARAEYLANKMTKGF